MTSKWIYTAELLGEGGKTGNMGMIEYAVEKGAKILKPEHYNSAAERAAENGHLGTIEKLLIIMANNGITPDYYWIMSMAGRGNHIEIVKRMMELGATNYNGTMSHAAMGGYEEIIDEMLEHGANNYNDAMGEAAGGGQRKIVEQMLKIMTEKGINPDYNDAMVYAAEKNQHEIVQIMVDFGANNFKEGLVKASGGGHQDMVIMMMDLLEKQNLVLTVNDYNAALVSAAECFKKEIVTMMLKLGANNYDEAIEKATVLYDEIVGTEAVNYYNEIVELIIEYRDTQ